MAIIFIALVLSGIVQNASALFLDLSRRNLIWSIVSIERHGDYLYVHAHTSPSAGRLLVLSQTLGLKREIDGWPVLVLDDGRVVFQRSMVHWAPAHAGVLAVYDPKGDRESNLYPSAPAGNARGVEPVGDSRYLFVDRSFFDVKPGTAPATIEFVAIVQRVRLASGEARAQPATTARRSIVTCDLSRAKPVCRERQAAASR